MQKICQWLLHILGWRFIGALPDLPKYLVIVAPHTSNWDLILGLIARFAIGVKVHFIAKKEIFVFPLSLLLKALGGTPVDRSRHLRVVDQIVEQYNERSEFVFGLAPEGTRSYVKRWKHGFYYMADTAKVPIVMVGFDFQKKEIQIQPPFYTSGHIEEDFPKILDYFRTVQGRHPKQLPDTY